MDLCMYLCIHVTYSTLIHTHFYLRLGISQIQSSSLQLCVIEHFGIILPAPQRTMQYFTYISVKHNGFATRRSQVRDLKGMVHFLPSYTLKTNTTVLDLSVCFVYGKLKNRPNTLKWVIVA